jgi:hypothetical protein
MCGHTFCHLCIKKIIKRKDYRFSVRCPEDRSSFNIDTNTPSHFPKNIALLEAILKQSNKDKEQYPNENN